MLHIRDVVASHFEIHVLQAERAQFLNTLRQIRFVPHRQAVVAEKVWRRALLMCFLHGGIARIGIHHLANALFFQRLFERRDIVRWLRALRRLAKFEFDRFRAALRQRVFRQAEGIVLHIYLRDDLTIAAVEFAEGVEHFIQLVKFHDLAIFDDSVRILAHGAFADHAIHARHRRAGEIILPVELDQRR